MTVWPPTTLMGLADLASDGEGSTIATRADPVLGWGPDRPERPRR